MRDIAELIQDLRRRRVFRVAGLYIVGAWILLQVFDLAFESWGVDESALRYVWIAALVLFPVALLFGWRYDFTGDGLVRTEAGHEDSDLRLRPFDIGLMVSVLVVVAVSGWLLMTSIDSAPVATAPDMMSEEAVQGSAAARTAVAVLPFAARSGIDDTAFFADGIHDDLLTRLAKVSGLKVISRTSVLAYRDTAKNLRDIGSELGAGSILEGGVQQVGDNVRINVQLIDAQTDEHLWAQTYDRELSMQNLFAIQTEIVETIATALETQLSPAEQQQIRSGTTDVADAFRAYMRGRQGMALASFDGYRDAIRRFGEALALDPAYTPALIGTADAYSRLAATGAISVAEMSALGRPFIDKALALAGNNGYAQAVRARFIDQESGQDVDALFQSAIALAPNDVDALTLYASYLRDKRRGEDAIAIIQRALELDPLSVLLWHELGRTRLTLGLFAEAQRAFDRIAEINPGNPYAAHGSAMATILAGELVQAAAYSDAAAEMDPVDYENPATAVFILVSIGEMEAARQHVEQALALGPQEPFPLAAEAYYLESIGQNEKAVAIARGALANDLDDRWGSEQVFLRLVRDDALQSGSYSEALGWYRQKVPALFDETAEIDFTNLGKAVDLGNLMLAAGDEAQARRLFVNTIAFYDADYARGAANFPLGIAKVDALALLGQDAAALTELQRLVDDGWRMRWQWDTLMNPNLASLRDASDFKAIIARIEADIRRQKDAARIRDY